MFIEFLLSTVLAAGAPSPEVAFEAPVRLKAGEQYLGHKRLYPSPVMHDVDGDNKVDMVIGDLIGKLTVASRDGTEWTTSKPLLGADGKELKFHNW